jgi:hypothetical protein
VLEVIQSAGFDPREFTWEEGPGWDNFVHLPSGYGFLFSQEGTLHRGAFQPGEEAVSERTGLVSWSQLLPAIPRWLNLVRREIEAPDLWAEVERERELVGEAVPEIENTPFTPEEQRQVAAGLNELKEYIKQTHELSDAQVRELEGRLDYLADAASRLPRLDWRNALLGAFFATVVSGLLPGEVVRDVLSMALRALAPMFGHEFPQLPP